MAHVPNDTILGGVIDIVQGNRNLHHAETRGQMAWIHCHFLHDVAPQFVAHLRQVFHLQPSQILGILDVVQQFIVRILHYRFLILGTKVRINE